jgi:hypothetical protein
MSNGYNTPELEIIRNYKNTEEYGRIGRKQFAGVFYEEFLPELRGVKGIEAFKEMAANDDIIGAILFAIKMMIRQATFDVEPQGDTEKDKKAAEFVKECMDDMTQTWQDTLSEILTFLPYGWSVNEIVYKRRMGNQKNKTLKSKFNDGLIAWKYLPTRAQDTLYKWEYDEEENLMGFSQMAPPDYAVRTIPINKCLHFVTESTKMNPEGRSILRNAYRSYYFKRRLQEIEGVGIERDLAGLPLLKAPDGVDIWNPDDPEMVETLRAAETLVQNVRRDAKEGIVIPPGWEFSLLSSGSKRQFEVGSVIDRYDKRMAMTVLADFILLGHQTTGSFALSNDKTHLFSVALGTYLDIICEAFNNQAIPQLIDLNEAAFKGITDYPKMVHGDVEKTNITEMAAYIEKMTGLGILQPDENLEQFVRRLGDLPDKVEGAELPNDPEINADDLKGTKDARKPNGKANIQQQEEDDEKKAKVAKEKLGRR